MIIEKVNLIAAFLQMKEEFIATTRPYDQARNIPSASLPTLPEDYTFDASLETMADFLKEIIETPTIQNQEIAKRFYDLVDANSEVYPLAFCTLLYITLCYTDRPDYCRLDTDCHEMLINQKWPAGWPCPTLSIYANLADKLTQQFGPYPETEYLSLSAEPPCFTPIVDYLLDSQAPQSEIEKFQDFLQAHYQRNPSYDAKQSLDRLKKAER